MMLTEEERGLQGSGEGAGGAGGADPQEPNRQQRRVLQGLQDLWSCGDLTDVTLVAGDTRLDCHRAVLAASSPYFRAMFTSGSCVESEQRCVTLQDVSGETLRALVTYLYSGDVAVTQDTVEALMTSASMLQLDGLVEDLEIHMLKALTVDNCLEVLSYADFHSLTMLKKNVKEFVADHFPQLLDMPSLMQLPCPLFRELLEADDLNVDEEETVYEALIQWVQEDIENRHQHFSKLFQLVRLPLVSQEFVESDLLKNPLVSRDPYCRGLVTISNLYRIQRGVLGDKAAEDDMFQDMEISVIPRFGMYKKVLLIFSGGGSKGMDERSFTAFDPDTQTNYVSIRHHPSFDFKFKIDHYRLVVTPSGGIYFVGGIFFDLYHWEREGDGQAMKEVLKFDQRQGVWAPCSPMNCGRCAHAVCALEGRVMVFGGYNKYPSFPPMTSCEVYDEELDQWSTLDTMPVGIAHQAATAHQDCVYLLGGIDDEECYLDTVLCYHVNRDTWSLLESKMAAPRAECSAFTFDGMVYVLGGCNQSGNVSTVQIYDPKRNKWRFGEDFPDDRKFTSVTQIGSHLYVCGGERRRLKTLRRTTSGGNVGRRVSTIETYDLYRYDMQGQSWSHVTRKVDVGCNVTCSAAMLNVKYLKEIEKPRV